MKASNKCIDLIIRFEGFRNQAYKCPAGVWTIGYGTTKYPNGRCVSAGDICTKSQGAEYLRHDVEKFEKNVNKYIPKYNFTQEQYDALVCFAYNIGSIDSLCANGTRSLSEISNKILAYNKAGGRELTGLTIRRKAEKTLFDSSNDSKVENRIDSFRKAKVVANTLNVRNKPNGDIVIKTLTKGKIVGIREEKEGWGRINVYKDDSKKTTISGWISLKYVK